MTDKNIRILESAQSIFLKYGMKRATMNDIALEAGVARQTLYNTYANKNQVICALVESFHAQAISDTARQMSDRQNLSDQLDAIFENMIFKPYDLITLSSHAAEIFEGINNIAHKEISNSKSQYITLIEKALSSKKAKSDDVTISSSDLAELIFCSAKGIKDYTESREELSKLLKTLKQVICTL